MPSVRRTRPYPTAGVEAVGAGTRGTEKALVPRRAARPRLPQVGGCRGRAARHAPVRARREDRGRRARGAHRRARSGAGGGRGSSSARTFWLADEWFSPDGVPGIAIPFYLAHPRLRRLELTLMHEVEGGSASGADDPAPRGGARDGNGSSAPAAGRPAVFGKSSGAYPESYRPASSAAATCCTSTPGMRRAIPRTSPRHLPSGSRPARSGATNTPAGRRCASSSTWTS